MPIAPFLAWRFLREGRFQTLLVIAGASIGITVVFFLTALVAAVERTMISQTLDVLPHVVVRRPDEVARSLRGDALASTFETVTKPGQRGRTILGWPSVLRELDDTPGVVAASPAVGGPALVSRAGATRAISVLGIETARFERVIAIAPRVRRGQLNVQGDAAVLGTDLASDLGNRRRRPREGGHGGT